MWRYGVRSSGRKFGSCAVLLCPVIVYVAACMKPTTPSTKKVHPTIWDPGFPEARYCVGALTLVLGAEGMLRTLHRHD